ncbi:MAG: sugar phosphate isomerase/epimerase family protein [Candidatus Fervidibacter sp.]|uniref:sugar phosphate isomerase/epimerase family protein n=1 Tax=Candidatus Fervidibacter sp. TaxID=3100871 RepID=UPI0040491E21
MAWQWLMFSKHLQDLDFEQLGRVVSGMGFEGVDLTVRNRGHIEPHEAGSKLPIATKMLQKFNLNLTMITTNFTDAAEPFAEDVFATASECEVKFIKLGYWRYREFGSLRRMVDSAKKSLEGIEKLSSRYGVCALVHTHSGNFLTASPFVLAELLEGFETDFVAAYVDAGHIFVEGGLMGWQQGLEVLSGKIKVVACKDFAWVRESGVWKVKVVPIGEGIVRWREFFGCLRHFGFDGPISVHSEYEGWTTEKIIAQTSKDLIALKRFSAESDNSG